MSGFLIDFLNPDLVSISAVLFVLGFLLWEIPRSVKIMDEEYTKGVYPDGGRIFDIILFVIGLLALFFFFSRMDDVINTMRMPTYSFPFTIIFLAIPLLILLGFGKRTLKRVDNQQSITIFLVHALLDLAHTVFFITFSMIFVPVVIFFVMNPAL